MRRRYYIQDRVSGAHKAAVESLEFHDEWMGESYVTVDAKSSEPIAFGVDDYIEYRGERFVIEGDASTLKQARRGSYGSGFEYKNMKLTSEALSKFVRCDFTDLVLGPDNQMHYTGLPTFPFYCESVDDLLDRIQACLEELFPGEFVLLGRNTARNRQRGQAVGREQGFIAAYQQWVDSGYQPGQETTDTYGKTGVAETVDNIGCWDALTKVKEDFDLTFIRRGYVIIVGAEGMPTRYTYRYGKGNGLKSIELIGNSDEKVVTRLKAYGNETNIPRRYYARLNAQYYMTIGAWADLEGTRCWVLNHAMCTPSIMFREKTYTTNGSWVAKTGIIHNGVFYGNIDVIYDALNYNALMIPQHMLPGVHNGDKIYFIANIDKDKWPSENIDYAQDALPNNMAVSRLMLPGFPDQSLDEWVRANRPELLEEGFTFSTDKHKPYIDSPNTAVYGIRPGSLFFDGSDDREDIYPTLEGMTYPFSGGMAVDIILNATDIQDDGVLPDEPKETDKRVEVTIPYGGFPLDQLWEQGAKIELKSGPCCARSLEIQSRPKLENGAWVCQCSRAYDDLLDLWFPYKDYPIIRNGETTKFVLTGIDLPEAYVQAASVRLFDESIAAIREIHQPKNTWKPTIDEVWMAREEDAAAESGGSSQHDTLTAGDIFMFEDEDLDVDTGIIIDTLTIREWGNNGIPTYEIALRDEKEASSISRLIGKVDTSGGTAGHSTPNQDAATVYNEGSKHFLSKEDDDEAQGVIGFIKGLWVKAKGLFGFDENGNVKANNAEIGGILTALNSIINNVESSNYTSGELTGTGFKLTNDNGSGNSRLEVDEVVARMKFVANVLEARKYVAMGGNYVFSPAASVIERVDYIRHIEGASGTDLAVEYAGGGTYEYHYDIPMMAGQTITLDPVNLSKYIRKGYSYVAEGTGEITYTATEDCNVRIGCYDGQAALSFSVSDINEILGYEELRMPWILRGVPLWIASKLMSKSRLVYTSVSDTDKANATIYRCWIKADDGTTKTINTWREGMLARCQTLDIKQSEGGTNNAHEETPTSDVSGYTGAGQNKFYWRAVVGKGQGELPVTDGKEHSYVDLSNESGKKYPTSQQVRNDIPEAGDSIVCYGDYLNRDTSNVIVIETVGEDAPAIKEFLEVGWKGDGTIDWSLTNKLMTRISPKRGNLFVAPEFKVIINNEKRDLATFIINTDGMLSEVKSVQDNGKNLLSGVLTGSGWKSCSSASLSATFHNVKVDNGKMSIDTSTYPNDTYIASPLVAVTEGKAYTFQLFWNTGGSYHLYVIGNDTNLVKYASGGGTLTYTFTAPATENVRIFFDKSSLASPQLELGDTATAFEADTKEVSSRIKQTADSIELKITDELGETGIDIENHEIDMSADKFTLKNLKGETVMSADSQGNVGVSGTIVAKNLYRVLCTVMYTTLGIEYIQANGESWVYVPTGGNAAMKAAIENSPWTDAQKAILYDYVDEYFQDNTYVDVNSVPDEVSGMAPKATILPYAVECTGFADLIILTNPSATDWADGTEFNIPKASDFGGKTLDIFHMGYKYSQTGSVSAYIRQVDGAEVFVTAYGIEGQAYPRVEMRNLQNNNHVLLYSNGSRWIVLGNGVPTGASS